MSFYKITDPKERRRMFEKLTQTRKHVQEQFLEDKIGRIESSKNLKTFFKPITESQRELTKEIREQLAPIRDKALTLPSHTLAIPPLEKAERDEELMNVGPIAAEYLEKYMDPEGEVDKMFGIHADGGTWKIGNEKVGVLIVSNKPSEQNYDDEDLRTYSKIMVNINVMRRNNDPNNPYPKSSKSWKWANVVKNIWMNRKTYERQGTKTVVIPSDPNVLLERSDLLMAIVKKLVTLEREMN